MVIRKADGTPFRTTGELRMFDPKNPRNELFNRWDAEAIRIAGTPILYFECLIQIQTIDQLYLEDRGKIFAQCPLQLYAFYQPPQQNNAAGQFGVLPLDEEVILELNYQETLKIIGHLPKVGSRIFTPHRNENWVIIDVRLDQFQYWGIFRLVLHCKKFQESVTSGESQVSQFIPN